jgi:hypothetical protein
MSATGSPFRCRSGDAKTKPSRVNRPGFVATDLMSRASTTSGETKPFRTEDLHPMDALRPFSVGAIEWRCKMERSRGLRSAVLGIGVIVASACGGTDEGRPDGTADSESDVQVSDALRGWHSRHHPPGTGGTTSSGGSSTTGGTTSAGGSSTSGGTTSAGGSSTGGGSAGSGGIPPATCELCTITQECCNAVNAGSLCTFSADTCSAYDPGRQHTYAVDCLVTLRTIISAWALAGQTPPAVCALPQ